MKKLSLPIVRGYDFNQGVNFDKIIDSFASTGFQATKLSQAITIINNMRSEKCTIFFGYTSNMVSSGLRDVFCYLAEHKLVDVIVTTAGGIEEDFIKCFAPFYLGDFEMKGADLRKNGVNRIGDILVPNSHYCRFEEWLLPMLTEFCKKNKNAVITPSDLIALLGKKINNKESIYYWASKNQIPVFCPAITDGSLGDMLYMFSYQHPEFKIDVVGDIKKLNNFVMDAKKTGLLVLGSGIVKHHICNANMFRNGADYAVYINNAQEFDGSDAGARPDEAVSWGKILPQAKTVKVFGDATILFPLIVAKTFAKVI
ncbi:MAG: deoxyhypusine synthase [Candidatus Woesearchaeota archaeon]|nr:deoxyhypusine synthase [Candidatus Woesearchaeota archaeon]